MEWLIATGGAVGGGVITFVPTFLLLWRQINTMRMENLKSTQELKAAHQESMQKLEAQKQEIESKAMRDEYDRKRLHESDAYQTAMKALQDSDVRLERLSEKLLAQEKKIDEMHAREMECDKRAAKLEGELYAVKLKLQAMEGHLTQLPSRAS